MALGKESPSPWCCLITAEPRLEFSASGALSSILSVAWVWICCVNLSQRVWVCVSVYDRRLCSVFIEQHGKYLIGKEWGTLQKSLTEFYKRLSHWFLLPPSGPDNSTINIIVYQAISKCCLQDLWWIVIFIWLLSISNFAVFSTWYTCKHTRITLGEGRGRIYKITSYAVALEVKVDYMGNPRQIRLAVPLFS